MKPKKSQKKDPTQSMGYDRCQTPEYAVEPLLPFLPPEWVIWEPAAGNGNIVHALRATGRTVIASDILDGQNFFEYAPTERWDCIVTNPPYSIKPEWVERCYELGKPWLLLMPVETIGTEGCQRFFRMFGIEVMWVTPRINFEMPNKGYSGSGAQFPTAWYAWKVFPEPMLFRRLSPRNDGVKQHALFEQERAA